LKESVLQEMEKASYHPKNSEKGCKRSNGAVWKAKTMNNGSTNPHWKLRLCPTISKNTLTKEGQNRPETAKTDL